MEKVDYEASQCLHRGLFPARSSTCLKLEPFRLALVKSASWNWHPSKSQFSSEADTSDAPWKVAPTTYESILPAKQDVRVNSSGITIIIDLYQARKREKATQIIPGMYIFQ